MVHRWILQNQPINPYPLQCETMPSFKELHQQSLQQYSTFYNLVLSLEKALEQPDTEEILHLTLELEQMQKTVHQTDNRINRSFQEGLTPEAEDLSLYEKRLGLMQKIIEKNNVLSPKIRAMMAMQAAELAKIKQGRNTLGGYATRTSKAGRIIDTAN